MLQFIVEYLFIEPGTGDIIRACTAMAMLLIASYYDVKERRVENILWFVFLPLGAAEMLFEVGTTPVRALAPAALMLFYMLVFFEGTSGTWVGGILGAAYLAVLYMSEGTGTFFIQVLTAVVMYGVIYGLYMAGIVHGGADAKCLMVLTLMFWRYPTWLDIPQGFQVLFPYSLTVLINAALVTVVSVPVYTAAKALSRGERTWFAFFGYPMDIERVERSFVWLMEVPEGDDTVLVLFPSRDEARMKERLEKLRDMGRKEVWVSPQVPFMVPLAAGMLLALTAGNLIVAAVLAALS